MRCHLICSAFTNFFPTPYFTLWETNVLGVRSDLNPSNRESKAITISTHEPAAGPSQPSVASVQAHIHDLISDRERGREGEDTTTERASFKDGGNALK